MKMAKKKTENVKMVTQYEEDCVWIDNNKIFNKLC